MQVALYAFPFSLGQGNVSQTTISSFKENPFNLNYSIQTPIRSHTEWVLLPRYCVFTLIIDGMMFL